jgi:tetratricopeptide (TPR) repeat protein
MGSSIEFVIDVRDFDSNLLPENSREIGSVSFQEAVVAWFTEQIQSLGSSAIVAVNDQSIQVQIANLGQFEDPLENAIDLLSGGELEQGVNILKLYAVLEPNNPSIRYNLGMALSDLGKLGDAAQHLERATILDPNNPRPWIALGVAQVRMGDSDAAKSSLEKAIALDPQDGYAHRNLGALLMQIGKPSEGGEHLEEAYRLLPGDPQAAFGYASWLIDRNTEQLKEADDILIKLIESYPGSHPVVELAKTQRSKLAMQNLREIGGEIRMDAVMYLVGAIEKFRNLDRLKVQEIGFEIAMKGQRGLDVNDPTQKYSLSTLSGNFSGLHLMCFMFAAFKVLDPTVDIGFDLSKEYGVAQSMVSKSE